MPELPAVVWMPNCMFETFAERSPRMAETPCLVLTPNVLTDLRNMDKTGICCNGYPWLRAALEAGNG